MTSGGEEIGEFIFDLILNLAWIKRIAMMMVMMMTSVVVVRIVSIRKTAATLVFMSKFLKKLVSFFSFFSFSKIEGERVGGRGGMDNENLCGDDEEDQ